jgi:hypothetical protein
MFADFSAASARAAVEPAPRPMIVVSAGIERTAGP